MAGLGQWVEDKGTDSREPSGQFIWWTPESTPTPLSQSGLDRLGWKWEESLELDPAQPLPRYVTLGLLLPCVFISKTEIIIPPHTGVLRVR